MSIFFIQLAVEFQKPCVLLGLVKGLSNVEKNSDIRLKTLFFGAAAAELFALSAFALSAAKSGTEIIKMDADTRTIIIFLIPYLRYNIYSIK